MIGIASTPLSPRGSLPERSRAFDLQHIAQLEESLLRVWPAVELEMMEGWAVRFAHGYSGRANSASAVRPGQSVSEQLLDRVTAFYASRRQPVIFRLSPMCDADAAARLRGLGFVSRGIAHTMTARVAVAARPGHDVVIESVPSLDWCRAVTERQEDPAKRNPNALLAILSRIAGPACFATVMKNGTPAGFAVAAVDRGWAEIGSVVIDSAHRGKGLGRGLMSSLLGWASSHGAANAYLQVDVTNEAALHLYRCIGFTTLYDYDTLVKATP